MKEQKRRIMSWVNSGVALRYTRWFAGLNALLPFKVATAFLISDYGVGLQVVVFVNKCAFTLFQVKM